MSRTFAREVALKTIFQIDFHEDEPISRYLDYLNKYRMKEDDHLYAKLLVKGVVENKNCLDEIIDNKLVKWKSDRLNKIELSILRLASYEIIYFNDVPKPVSINEAINFTTKFGSVDGVKYINAVLQNIDKDDIN